MNLTDYANELCRAANVPPIGGVVEMHRKALSPYNRIAGFYDFNTETIHILARHIKTEQAKLDLVAHEVAHHVQHHRFRDLMTGKRGTHRDASWWNAVAVLNPPVLGFPIHEDQYPWLRSVRDGNTVTKELWPHGYTEVEMTHWPEMVRTRGEIPHVPRPQARRGRPPKPPKDDVGQD